MFPLSPLHTVDRKLNAAPKVLSVTLALALLAGCSTSPNGRLQMTAPAPVSQVYSEVDLQLSLAGAGTLERNCTANDCTLDQQFDQQVKQTGEKLSRAALALFPDSTAEFGQFSFEVADKNKVATSSNAKGKIVLTRGVQQLHLDDPALAFLMAREMGRVIGKHHDENTGTRLLISVLAGVLFPASGLFSAGSAATQATATSSVLSSAGMATAAVSSATSYLGSKIALETIKPKQMSEADFVAVALLREAGWDLREIRDGLASSPQPEADDAWSKDFRTSLARLDDWGKQAAAAEVIAQAETDAAAQAESARLAALEQSEPLQPADQSGQQAESVAATPPASTELPQAVAAAMVVAALDTPVALTPAPQVTTADATSATPVEIADDAEESADAEVAEEEGVTLISAVEMASPVAAKLALGKTGGAKLKSPAGSKLSSSKKSGKTRLASARTSKKSASGKKNALNVASAKTAKRTSTARASVASSSFVSRVKPTHQSSTKSHAKLNKSLRAAVRQPKPKL